MDPIADLVTLVAVAVGLACFYFAKGRTLSDLLTRTRVTYDMPADERERPRAAEPPTVG